MGCLVYWREFFGEEIGDVKGFHQLKKLHSSGLTYLTPWSICNNPVTPIPAMKKGFRYGWWVFYCRG